MVSLQVAVAKLELIQAARRFFLSPARLGAIAIGHETKCASDILMK